MININRLFVLCIMTFVLSGCIWGKNNGLIFNEQQRIVMEPSVLAEGIIVENPIIRVENYQTVATINMSNIQAYPVAVLYRIYWYDEKGLKIETTASLEKKIPANSSVSVKAINPSPLARNVRIYIFLPPTAGE
ncbi:MULTISPECIES: YcfL family protein [Providencia]|uniref:Putative lipoprotein n=1 Tax=Providencia heimbachae ATCC 35613 TaxID=1354272 RepID=A0A1B7JHC9_9GAMM|nr:MULTISPECIES: YcfL family protein [Providencia]MDD9341664.1 YcfL family protein [Providencia heimbachae]OAT47332.1 putative lipoprotein [Providencia heimbachae ATCC 35613]SQH12958.1 Predicted periplasmic lipoprotein [Providencia heimbachae]